MLNFLKIAQRQLNTEFESAEPFLEPGDVAATKLHEENALLKERNRHLEAKVARLHSMLKGVDSDFIARERACDEKAEMVNAAIKKLNAAKREMRKVLEKAEQDLQEAKERHRKDWHKLQAGQKQIEEITAAYKALNQKKIEMEQMLHQAEHRIFQLESQLRQMESDPFHENFDYAPMEESVAFSHSFSKAKASRAEEEYPVTSLPAGQSMNNGHSEKLNHRGRRPFGYSDVNYGIYMRGSSPSDPSDSRLATLEKKVEQLSGELTEIKQCLTQICQSLGTTEQKPSGPGTYDNIQDFLGNEG